MILHKTIIAQEGPDAGAFLDSTWFCTLVILGCLSIGCQGIAGFVYWVANPELTQMELLLKFRDWAIPLRWIGA